VATVALAVSVVVRRSSRERRRRSRSWEMGTTICCWLHEQGVDVILRPIRTKREEGGKEDL
jgi:hypothetical protein